MEMWALACLNPKKQYNNGGYNIRSIKVDFIEKYKNGNIPKSKRIMDQTERKHARIMA